MHLFKPKPKINLNNSSIAFLESGRNEKKYLNGSVVIVCIGKCVLLLSSNWISDKIQNQSLHTRVH